MDDRVFCVVYHDVDYVVVGLGESSETVGIAAAAATYHEIAASAYCHLLTIFVVVEIAYVFDHQISVAEPAVLVLV